MSATEPMDPDFPSVVPAFWDNLACSPQRARELTSRAARRAWRRRLPDVEVMATIISTEMIPWAADTPLENRVGYPLSDMGVEQMFARGELSAAKFTQIMADLTDSPRCTRTWPW